MSVSSIGIVWNPSKIDGDEVRAAVDEVFGADAPIRWWETSIDDPGRGMAEEAVAKGCDVVVAVGGDGTVRAVAEGLAGTEVALGIVPQGTGNLLARNLGVPLTGMVAAFERVRDSTPQHIDLGWVEFDGQTRAFAVMVGFGIDAQMLVETNDDLKDRAGWLAYVEAMGRALAGTEMTDITVTVDDREPEEVRGHTMLIGNCGMLQGGLRLLPDAQLDDGLLDILLISSEGALQWMSTLRSVVWDNGIRRLLTGGDETVSTDSAQHLAVERIEVSLAQPLVFEIDGEEMGEITRFAVWVQPGALTVR